MKVEPMLYLDLRCDEGRKVVHIPLTQFDSAQLGNMVALFALAERGVEFAVRPSDDGRPCLNVLFGVPKGAMVQ